MIKRVLVGLAGTPYTPVDIQRAIMIAQSNSAEVTGVTVLDLSRIRRLAHVQSAWTTADNRDKYPRELEVVAFNDIGDLKTMANLLK